MKMPVKAPAFEEPTLKQCDLNFYLITGSKKCILCNSESVRKYTLFLWHRYKIKCCFFCLIKYGNPGIVADWFEKNLEAPRNEKGQFLVQKVKP